MLRTACRTLAAYLAAVLVCLILLVLVMKLWRVDLHVPFCYYWDGLFEGVWIKSVLDTGWYLENPYLGSPGTLDFHDWPMGHDNLHFLLVKFLAFFTSDFGLICNIYALLTFPLTTICSLFVFRRLGFSFGPALVGSLLFAFLPYHFFRLQVGHLFVAGYFLVPLMILVIIWIYRDEIVCRQVTPEGKVRRRFSTGRALSSVLICLLVCAGGVYYAFFACFFLVIAGMTAALYRRALYPWITGCALIAVIVLGGIANVFPTILYRYSNGTNPEALVRCTQGAEIHGMKIVQLLLPLTDHRVGPLAELKGRYNRAPAPLVTDNDWSSLGVCASLGFLFLLAYFLFRTRSSAEPTTLYWVSQLNLCAVLLATIGGFGALFSLTVSDLIRSYTRMSIYIAFFSLFPVLLALERLSARFQGSMRARLAWPLLLGSITLFGILDQTNRGSAPPYESIYGNITNYKLDYENDHAFVQELEESVRAGSWIFQLPYVPFPERPPVQKMQDYDLCRGYLHSRTLHWSHASIKGGGADAWRKELAEKPIQEQVRTAALAGFAGIYLDRAGFADNGTSVESSLKTLLGPTSLVSRNQRLAFYDLTHYREILKEHYSEGVWQSLTDAARHPLFATWRRGFLEQEGPPNESWRWCARTGSLVFENTSARPRKAILVMAFQTATGAPAQLKLQSELLSAEMIIDGGMTHWSKEVSIPPGKHEISFVCDGHRQRTKYDTRTRVFRVLNFTAHDPDNYPDSYAVSRR
jgi:phosphoglycerol transferase